MKISYRTHPILEKLQMCSYENMPIFETDKINFNKHLFIKEWSLYNQAFNEEINVISKTFIDSACKAARKLNDLWIDISNDKKIDISIKGTYIIADFVFMIDYEIINGITKQILYVFNKNGVPLKMYNYNEKNNKTPHYWLSNVFLCNYNTKEKQIKYFEKSFAIIILFKMFKSYADVETKILKPYSKLKEINCKYVNDTKLELTYLDSKWFTNLVKSDSFNVRGHFRLQPKKKDGKWTKELIWIAGFEKKGYTAKARKIMHEH